MTLFAVLAGVIGVVVTIVGVGVTVFLTKAMLWPTSEARTAPDGLRMVTSGVVLGCAVGGVLIIGGAPPLACLCAVPAGAVFGVLFSTGSLTVGFEPAKPVPAAVMSGLALLGLTVTAMWRWGS